MTATQRWRRNDAMIDQVHAPMQNAVFTLVRALERAGYTPRIQCAWRSPAEQRAAKQAGHSKVAWGLHCAVDAHGAPDALAADVVDDDAPLEPSAHFVELLHRAAEAHGLGCPISWDRCHVEYVKLSLAAARRGERPRPEDL